jgi:peptidyl-prolyl cis-trans isomerase-like 4
VTASDDISQLDEKHTIFGQVSEGLDVVSRIADAYADDTGRPWVNLRIHHTIVLDDPFPDPPGLEALLPERSPEFVKIEDDGRLEDDWQPGDDARCAAVLPCVCAHVDGSA